MSTALDIVRALFFVAALQLVGLLVFRLAFSPREFTGSGFRRLALLVTGAVFTAMLVWFPIEAVLMSGENWRQVLADGTYETVLVATRFGHIWCARLVIFIAVGIVLVFTSHRSVMFAAILAAIGLALSAASGHAGAGNGTAGLVQLIADALHLVAAGAWIGGLLPFAWIMTRYVRAASDASLNDAYCAAHRFSLLGIACVGAILITGGINSWFLVGNFPALIGTEYGRLLLIKLALFAGIVGIAALNRLRLTPRARQREIGAVRALRRNASIEAVIGLVVIAIVGVLGTLPPAAHDQPIWPFSFRLEWTPYPTIAKAYPTSFVPSPITYAAPSIARGQSIYAQNCAVCHGLDGRGDGPAAAGLAVKPADLLAHHLFAHLDGELFWWISRGIGDAMPPFEASLNERDRWDVINFIRARNAGFTTQDIPPRAGNTTAPLMPDFAFETDGGQRTLSQVLRQSAVLLVLFRSSDVEPRLNELKAAMPRLKDMGLAVLMVALDTQALTPALAVRVTPDVTTMLKLFFSKDTGNSEYLIDSNAYIRARWQAGVDVAILLDNLERMKSMPLARTAEHHH